MVKNTKQKGTTLENEFKVYFQKWGYLVTRAAGSFGIDLVAVKKGCKPLIINVKWLRVYCGPKERLSLLDDAYKAGGIPILAYKKIPKGKKNGKRVIEILYCISETGDTLGVEWLDELFESASSNDWFEVKQRFHQEQPQKPQPCIGLKK